MKKSILIPFFLVVVIVLIIVAVALINYYDLPELDVPEGFIVKKHQYYNDDFDAWSGDDCRIVINQFRNIDEAPLSYHVEKTKQKLTLNDKCMFIEEKDFTTTNGDAGKYLVFDKMIEQVMYTYVVGIVSDESMVYVIESIGEKEIFAKRKVDILKSFDTLN
ncbi:MAG: hypothetical protein K8S87_11720 [Planctomycetes bacterium]|nr:hypothetical protein [Planctomycetota bacterium]